MRLTEPRLKWKLDDEIINAVITAAVQSEGQRPGIWGRMIAALGQAAQKTEENTIDAVLFQAMVDRLLEEFHRLDAGGSETIP